MLCGCGGVTGVINSRPRSAGAVIYRMRICVVCGERFATYEMRPNEFDPADADDVMTMRQKMLEAQAALAAVLAIMGGTGDQP